jgi:hypothetical protein
MSCARTIEWHFAIGCADQIFDAAGHREKLMFATWVHSQEAFSLSVMLQNVNGFVKKNCKHSFRFAFESECFCAKITILFCDLLIDDRTGRCMSGAC